jgi:hypothetical protein
VTLEELRRQAERAKSIYEGLDRDRDEAEDEVERAQAAGDTELERTWQERAKQLDDAASRAWERAEQAEEAFAEAEYEAEYPEEAAAERAAATVRARELWDVLLDKGTITPELYTRLTGDQPPVKRLSGCPAPRERVSVRYQRPGNLARSTAPGRPETNATFRTITRPATHGRIIEFTDSTSILP